MVTTIQVEEKLKKKLDSLKIHHRETYNDLIARLVENSNPNHTDKESLIATIEVLSDPELMKGIKEALIRIDEGDYGTSIEDLEKELGIN